MYLSPRVADIIKRTVNNGNLAGPDGSDSHPTNTANDSHSTLSTGGVIALVVTMCSVLLLLCFTAVYCIYRRHRKETAQQELEVGQDGTKITMKVEKEQRKRWWGRRGSGTSQQTLVRDEASTRGSVVVRNDA
jgi:hypothetical protein